MGKIAFVFSGQGDQYPGMGKELYDRHPAARQIFELCDRMRPETSKQCFYGSEEELRETKNTQPDLFALECAYAAVLMEKGLQPDCLAGFSLGEVTATVIGGMFTVDKGFTLVCKRGELMQREADKYNTFMAAILKLEEKEIAGLCNRFGGIYQVNFNCPGQITVSGISDCLEEFSEAVRSAGGRIQILNVSGAFHSPLMKFAAEEFKKEVGKIGILTPRIPVYSDVTAKPYFGDYEELLSRQICSPVMWEKVIRNMIAEGVTDFIEIGPGKTLTNMMKRIDQSVRATAVIDYMEDMGW